MEIKLNRILPALALACAALIPSHAQDVFKYQGCGDVTQASFNKITLVDLNKDNTLEEPIRFAVAKSGAVYFAERGGGLKVIKTDGSIVKIGDISVFPLNSKLKIGGSDELGLTGLTLDPAFETNHWIYVNYEPPSPDVMKVSRFTLNADVLDLTSEKVLLSFPMQKNFCCHTGGGMQFDNKGNLWMSVGNNTRNPEIASPNGYVDTTVANSDGDDQGHAANTNDYRGKILRFHPTADGTYTIPPGNFKDQFASMYTDAEKAKIKPEIYTMGHRNAYTISVDTVKNLLSWGDVGPDEGWATEEFNMVDKPGFMGWPYFAGEETNPHYKYRLNKDPAAPMNTSSNNTGVQKLPPAVGATIGYNQSAAITGPIYHFSNGQTSTKKVPPHFDDKWFIADFDQGWVHVATLDATGTKVTEQKALITGLTRPLQISIGPDGLLYTLEYASNYFTTDGATRISRWEYRGSACAVGIKANEKLASAANTQSQFLFLGTNISRSLLIPNGATKFKLFDLKGKLIWESKIDIRVSEHVSIPEHIGNGLFHIRFI